MAPDLNSLPPSRSSSTANTAASTVGRTMPSSIDAAAALRGQTPSPSSRSASTSLQAAAAVNAGLQHEESRRSSSGSVSRSRQSPVAGRRRSNVMMNLQLNDPSVPAPGEMITEHHVSSFRTSSPHSLAGSPIIATGDPHHFRTPSLGEIHQELEQEQEAQVNRLLQMIRQQQQQLQQLQAASGQIHTPTAVDDSTPTSERSMSFSTATALQGGGTGGSTLPRSPSTAAHPLIFPHALPRGSFETPRDIARRSRTPSRTASPRLRSTSISVEGGEGFNLGGRDESAFYQAETQMLTRENQMLRMRVRELERQLGELHAHSPVTHEPATSSHLNRSESVSERDAPTHAQGVPVPSDGTKDD